jgi:VanZ family protein
MPLLLSFGNKGLIVIRTFKKFPSRAAAILLAVYWVVIFLGTHMPGGPDKPVWGSDKVLHFSAYAGLGILLGCVMLRSRTTMLRFLAGWSIVILYGAVDEFSQIWAQGRTADVWDWTADVTGGAIGLMLLLVVQSWWARRATRHCSTANLVAGRP